MEKIEFGAEKLPGYIAGPVGAPGVICLQEAWGVTDEMKEFSIKIASKGYRVLLPDLYKGKIGLEMEEVMHLYKNFDFPKGVQEIGEAAKYLREHGSAKVGVVGFCMGGGLALAAAQSAGVDCAVPFYGMPPVELCQPETLKVPIQGHFGELDHSPVANKEAALALDAKLKTCPAAAHVSDPIGARSLFWKPRPLAPAVRGVHLRGRGPRVHEPLDGDGAEAAGDVQPPDPEGGQPGTRLGPAVRLLRQAPQGVKA